MSKTDLVAAKKEDDGEVAVLLDEDQHHHDKPLLIHLISHDNAEDACPTAPAQKRLESDEEKSTASATECSTTRSERRFHVFVFALLVLLAYFVVGSFHANGFMEGAGESADVAALSERFLAAFPHLKNTAHSLFPSLLLNGTFFHDLLASSSHDGVTTKQLIGRRLYEQGARVNHPVVMVPGFVTSGLEVWAAKDCMKRFFRQRLWTAVTGATSFLGERECWKEHMMLDPWTGSDPDGIRVRAAEGFGAADFFLMNYWVR
jgi:Lecithin:cholesterol acyltransferase